MWWHGVGVQTFQIFCVGNKAEQKHPLHTKRLLPTTHLNVRVHYQLSQPEDFSTKMERISQPRFLPLFRGQGLDGLEVEIVI